MALADLTVHQFLMWRSPVHQFLTNIGIEPTWEKNPGGGKWVITLTGNPLSFDQCWLKLIAAAIGEWLDEADDVCGIVVSGATATAAAAAVFCPCCRLPPPLLAPPLSQCTPITLGRALYNLSVCLARKHCLLCTSGPMGGVGGLYHAEAR